jgi:P27 family predicted phage terminase small subunit
MVGFRARPKGAYVRNPTTMSFDATVGGERAKPPAHLSRQAKRWWRSVMDMYDLEPHHVAILTAAAEAWDRKEDARLIISQEGAVIRVGNGAPMAHPAVQVEDVAAMRFAHLVRELGLDSSTSAEVHVP